MGSAIENGGEKGFLNNMTKIISGFGGSISIFLLHFKANWDLESIGAFNRVSVRAQESEVLESVAVLDPGSIRA